MLANSGAIAYNRGPGSRILIEVISVTAANEEAAKIETLASARQKAIELAGDITEKERVALEIERDRQIGIAKALADGLSKTKLPDTMIVGGGGGAGGQSNTLQQLMSMWLLGEIDKQPKKK